jgi:hypothetical protein
MAQHKATVACNVDGSWYISPRYMMVICLNSSRSENMKKEHLMVASLPEFRWQPCVTNGAPHNIDGTSDYIWCDCTKHAGI